MATPTYLELYQASANADFLDRLAIAVAYYARYIINENPATSNHQRRFQWASAAILSPRGMAIQLFASIILDSVFTTQNPLSIATITDSQLQPVVETAINTTLLQF